jgi:hypothetical protein
MSEYSYKRCRNCAYLKKDKYRYERCHSVSFMTIKVEDGIICKTFPEVSNSSIRGDNGGCSSFKPTRRYSAALIMSSIKLKWFKHRYPEKFI